MYGVYGLYLEYCTQSIGTYVGSSFLQPIQSSVNRIDPRTNNGIPRQIEIQSKAIHEDVDISNWIWHPGMAITINICNIFFI